MKYFTPDLLVRADSEDYKIADAAHEAWEKATERYLEFLRTIRTKLHAGARLLTRKICLHDARVKMVATGENPLTLILFLQLAAPSSVGVQLSYELVAKPKMIVHPQLAESGTPLEWLYDEFDLVKKETARTFTHSILFTGGQEMQLRFRGLKVQVFENFKCSEHELEEALVGG